jgi:hypothetical protein
VLDFWIGQAFHSELSSILKRNYSFLFDERKWKSYNKNVNYGESGIEALKSNKVSQIFDLELRSKGILMKYGLAGVEEDFSYYAENLFSSKLVFWEIVKSQSRVRKKNRPSHSILQYDR